MVRPHMSCLMRHRKDEPSSRRFSFLSKFFSSAQIETSLFGSPNLHPFRLLAPSCTQKNHWLNLSLRIALIFFSQLILIDPFIQKSWNFHQKSLNSWWYKSRLDQMVADSFGTDQSCEIHFQSIFMKVIWSTADYLSTIDTNLGLIRWLLIGLAPGQPWKQNHIEISCDWLYQKYWLGIDTVLCCIGIVLVQLIGFDLGFFSCISSFDLSGVNKEPPTKAGPEEFDKLKGLLWCTYPTHLSSS
jgi:hypothetical protein